MQSAIRYTAPSNYLEKASYEFTAFQKYYNILWGIFPLRLLPSSHSCGFVHISLTPEKTPTVAFFIALHGAAARPAGRCKHISFSRSSFSYSAPEKARSRSTCGAFGKAAHVTFKSGRHHGNPNYSALILSMCP